MTGNVSLHLPGVVAQPVNSAILKALPNLLVTHLFLHNSHNITYVVVVHLDIMCEWNAPFQRWSKAAYCLSCLLCLPLLIFTANTT